MCYVLGREGSLSSNPDGRREMTLFVGGIITANMKGKDLGRRSCSPKDSGRRGGNAQSLS